MSKKNDNNNYNGNWVKLEIDKQNNTPKSNVSSKQKGGSHQHNMFVDERNSTAVSSMVGNKLGGRGDGVNALLSPLSLCDCRASECIFIAPTPKVLWGKQRCITTTAAFCRYTINFFF